MLVSHLHEFVFIKTRKTAGTSIEIALSPQMGPDDVLTALGLDEDEALRIEWGGRSPQNEAIPRHRWRPWHWALAAAGREMRYFDHMPAESVRRFIGRARWERYLTFAVDRNPWDLTVSAYWWHYRPGRREVEPFEHFVMSEAIKRYSTWRVYSSRATVIVDRVLRYDQLEIQLGEITDQLKLPRLELPHAKSIQRVDRRPYQEWYTDATRSRVGQVFQREIDHMGWTFD